METPTCALLDGFSEISLGEGTQETKLSEELRKPGEQVLAA